MNTEQGTGETRDDHGADSNRTPAAPAVGTEAEQKGGKEPAKVQAERDWEHSAKESGE